MAWDGNFDPFAALGLERGASRQDIKSRYYKLSRLYHPNRNTSGVTETFQRINQAWQLLSREERRRRSVELLELYDLQEVVLATVADLLDSDEHSEQHVSQKSQIDDGHVSSDADDDDLSGIIGLRRRDTLERVPKRSRGLDGIAEASDSSTQVSMAAERGRARFSTSRSRYSSGKNEGSSSDTNNNHKAADRRRRLDKLRRKELETFNRYHDAMINKFDAEAAAERCKELFEQSRWRREYFERAPRDASERMRLIRLFSAAAKALGTRQPLRKRNRSTISSSTPLLPVHPTEANQYLNLPSRTKSVRHKGYSSDISGDQTSSDEVMSENATSPTRSVRASSPRPGTRPKHRRWESVPNISTAVSRDLPNSGHDPMSPIVGPGPKLFVRAPTNLNEMSLNAFDIQVSDADSASASSRSASPAGRPDSDQLALVPVQRASDLFGGVQDHTTPSPSVERRSMTIQGHEFGTRSSSNDNCLFQIKQVGELQLRHIPVSCVHELTFAEKQQLGVEADADMDPALLLRSLSKLDSAAAGVFMVKPDVKAEFCFRLIYSHREVTKQAHRTFIALSYRRKLHVERHHNHFTLPLEQAMFQAVWDERLSDNEGVWIDQICIDQNNDQERTISMSAMDMVYRSARLVVVALDDVELEPHEATILESHMSEYEHQVHVPANKRFRRRQTPYLESHPELFGVIRKMLESSWFRRAWCRHEMRLAREHIFLIPGSRSGKKVLRFTGKCLTHFLGLATEVPFESSIESVKSALYAFFRDRSKLHAHDHFLRAHHGNFTSVVAEVFAMEAGGDPRIAEEQRAADARKDKISIILNTMECGLALSPRVRATAISLPEHECHYILLLLALATRDPGALASVGRPLRQMPFDLSSSWLFEPTNVDSGLNNYRTLNRLPESCRITTHQHNGDSYVELHLKFLKAGTAFNARESPDSLVLANRFMDVCDRHKLGRNRKRYLLDNTMFRSLFGDMRDVYMETLVCVFECGPDWMSDVCQRYGVGRWKHDLQPAYELLIAFKNTCGRWPEDAWNHQAAGFIMDFANFLIIRGMPQRQLNQPEEWRPVWGPTPRGGKIVTFAPPGQVMVAVPVALLDSDYIHLARLWVIQPRGRGIHDRDALLHHDEWNLLGKSVLFGDDISIELLETDNGMIRGGQQVYGRSGVSAPANNRRRLLQP